MDLGQYDAIRDSRVSRQNALNNVRNTKEYKELEREARRLRQYIGGLPLYVNDLLANESLKMTLKKMAVLRKNI